MSAVTTALALAAGKRTPAPAPTKTPALPAIDWEQVGSSLMRNQLLLAALTVLVASALAWATVRLRRSRGLRSVAALAGWSGGAVLCLYSAAIASYFLKPRSEPLSLPEQDFVAALVLSPLMLLGAWRWAPRATVTAFEQTRLAGAYYRWALTTRKPVAGTSRYLARVELAADHADGVLLDATIHDPVTLAQLHRMQFKLRGQKASRIAGYWLILDTQRDQNGQTMPQVSNRGLIRRLDHQTVLSGSRCLRQGQQD